MSWNERSSAVGGPVEVSVSVWPMLHGFAMLTVQKQFDFLQPGPGRLAALVSRQIQRAVRVLQDTVSFISGQVRHGCTKARGIC